MTTDPRELRWKSEWGFQSATDDSRLYMRESAGSMIAGIVFSIVLGAAAGVLGVKLLFTESTLFARSFGAFMLLVCALFIYGLWYSARKGRWMIVYDRGQNGEIRFNRKRISVERIRCLSTRSFGGSVSMPKRTVVAELHDGTVETLGPDGVSTWPDHWGQQAATWMNLPFRVTRE